MGYNNCCLFNIARLSSILSVILCTDDKGIFMSDSSQEYILASKAFHLGKKELYDLAYKSVDYIFDTEQVKEELRRVFKEFEANYR